MKLPFALPLFFTVASLVAAENEIGFIEAFALASDRSTALGQFIPGSEDFYYYHALEAQSTGKVTELKSVLEQWARRYPQSDRRRVIENRAALLGYDRDPQETLRYLRDRLNLDFSHEPIVRDQQPDLPTRLDQSRIAREVFRAEALQADDLGGMDDAALDSLVREKVELRPPQLRALLSRLKRPDVPGLLDLIETALRSKESRGFGEFPIHKQLLPEQLDELAGRISTLWENNAFVFARLRTLLPSADADTEYDFAEREAWLDRAWAFAAKLSPAFNTLKAQLLYQRLVHDRTRGAYDKARFVEYLQLPRRAGYANPRYAEQSGAAAYPVDLNANSTGEIAALPPIGNDEWLVRDYLLRLLRDEETWEPWATWLLDTYVKPIFAEAKIVNGIGNPEQWASLLTPQAFQLLKDRVDVDFSAANPRFHAPVDEVSLDLLVKNVPKLIVKLYEVNSLSFFLSQKRQLNTDLNLDGLVANQEATHDFTADEAGRNPFRRVPRIFDFPELKGRRGAWIVEFIGGGKSSRALIRKGQWHLIQQTGPAGDMLTVLDEKFVPAKDAVVWIDGRKLTADEKSGFIVVPFTQQPGPKPVILANADGSFATLTQFEHHAEQYRLDAQFHLEREQLLSRREATLAVRAGLLLGDSPVPVSLLEAVRLTLITRTLEGVATTKEIKDVKLDPAKLFTHAFPMPERIASIEITLAGKIENLSAGGQKQDLTATHRISLNGIDKTEAVVDGQLSKFGDSYVFEMLGKNGEPRPGQVVHFEITHRHFGRALELDLSTDARGRVQLGSLAGIAAVGASLANERAQTWHLDEAGAERPTALHGVAGEVFRVPWIAGEEKLRTGDVSLLEKRGGICVKDYFSALSLAGGFLEIKGLPPGDYSLLLRGEAREITLRVTAGAPVRNWLLSPNRHLEVRNPAPVQIEAVRAERDSVVVQLRNANRFTRVHFAASRFIPTEQALAELGAFDRFEPALADPPRRPNLFAAGRAIGDEYRYILERRYAKTYPGNMLSRPGLLLQPWEVRSTDLEAQTMAESEALRQSAGDREMRAKIAQKQESMEFKQPPADETGSNLDFLATAASVLYNLVPDNAGVVRIDRKALGDRQYVQIYAEDLTSAAWRTLALPEVPTKFQDLRLARGLDPAKPFTEKKEVAILGAGQTLALADILTSELETYDSLAGVHSLLSTLNADANFAKFAFILQWPQLKEAEQRAKYSEFACHELNFFLSRKDPVFFQAVVQPYLRNKKDKTFMDDYLIGADLKRYLEPWAHARLNAVERSLLARRIAGEAPATARHLRELWELLPPNPDEQDRLFETALRGRALSDAEAGEFKSARAEAEKAAVPALADVDRIAAGAAPAVSMPAPMRALGRMGAPASPPVVAEKAKAERETDAVGKELAPADPARPALTDPIGLEQLGIADAVRLRGAVRQYFRELGPTKEWAENNYYRLPLAQQNATLITVNAFWRDYAAWDGKAPFLSEHVAEASRNFSEMMLALAVLDLPFEAAKHPSKTDAGAFTLTAGSPLIAFHKQIKPADAPPAGEAGSGPALLVSENFFRADDRYREEGNEKFDKYVTEEFLPGILYGANLVVTNPRSTAQKLDLLLQIPQGALPAKGSRATDSRRIRLEPFTTQTFEYFFYFPAPAPRAFVHYAVHVSRDGRAVGAAQAQTFKVVKQLSIEDKTTWEYVSQSGTDAEVFAFLEKHNLARLDLEAVAWRARKDAKFFRKITALLAQHHVWNEPIYRYSVLHNDAPALREWLRHRDDFLAQCGPWLDSKLIKIDPVERRAYEHLEYSPLVNQRAHRVGAVNKVPNPILRAQYQRLLEILAHQPALTDADQLSVVYYLFLQDRIEEALARFHAIRPEKLPTRLQYDYLRCSAAFYEEQLAEARKIAASYASHPVDRWRTLFTEVTAQLDEIEGKAAARSASDQPDRDQQQATLAASEPSFDFKVENRTIALAWKNLREVTINYYLMDPEFLFSGSPFVTQDSSRFSIIKPTQSAAQKLPTDRTTLDIPLPAAFAKANVLVEVLGAGQRKAQPYHANTFKLALTENYGRLELRDTPADQPVAKAYVKVYARLKNGSVRFFKDGYTDLRGRFDYASLNSSDHPAPPHPMPVVRGGASGLDYQMLAPAELNEVERLAILILSDTHGAMVREVSPPSR